MTRRSAGCAPPRLSALVSSHRPEKPVARYAQERAGCPEDRAPVFPSVARRALRRVRAATGFAAYRHTHQKKEEKTRAPEFGDESVLAVGVSASRRKAIRLCSWQAASVRRAEGRRRDRRQRMKESKARNVTPRPDPTSRKASSGKRSRRGQPDRRRRPSRRRQEEAAGGRFRARAAAIRSNPPPSIRSVQRGCPPTAPRRTAEAQHAASVRAQAARPSAAPCQARRPAGRGVWERRAWRAGCLPQQPA